jgi:general secretion pathway protein C
LKLNWKSALIPSQWQGPYLDYLPVIAGLLLALGVGHSLAQLTWALWSGPRYAYQVPATPLSGPGQAATTAQALPEISALHLFGKFELPTTPAAPTEIPVTPLNLLLRGVIAADNPASARAIIADQSGKEDYYAINAELPGGAKLKEIYTDRIILVRNNQDEVLRLPREGSDANIPVAVPVDAVPPPPPAPIPEPQQQAPVPVPAASAAGAKAPSPEQNAETLSILRSYRDALQTNPQALAGVAKAEPVTEGNRQLGYRINAGHDPTFLPRFGLEPGDIITTVNGVVLDNPAKGLEAVGKLGSASQVNISILRNGQPRALSFNLNQ